MDRVRRMIGCDSREVIPYTGKGIYVGVLDSGVASHPDLRGRIAAFKDFTSNKKTHYDDNGHGTHVCGIIAGSGIASKAGTEELHRSVCLCVQRFWTKKVEEA